MNLYRFLEPGETIIEGDEWRDGRLRWVPVHPSFASTPATYADIRRLVITLPVGIEPAETDDEGWIRLNTDLWPHLAQWVRRDRIPGIIAALLAAWQAGAS